MDSLTDFYNSQIIPMDEQLEKEAAEIVKEAEEQEYAGRIMARGFADELNKLAGGPADVGPLRGAPTQFGSAAFQRSQSNARKTPMAEAPQKPKNINFTQGSTIKARKPAAPKQTRAQAVSRAKGIAGLAKGVGNFNAGGGSLLAKNK